MKFIIGSDIHGSIYYAEKFMKIADQIQADQILLLGDLYYNGEMILLKTTLPKKWSRS